MNFTPHGCYVDHVTNHLHSTFLMIQKHVLYLGIFPLLETISMPRPGDSGMPRKEKSS